MLSARSCPVAALAAALLALPACTEPDDDDDIFIGDDDTGDDDDSDEDYSDVLFDPDELVEVHIEIDPDDADALASETTSILDLVIGEDCLDDPLGMTFTWFEADVTVNGTTLEDVGIRKKGLIGSLSTSKPGLKLKFDKWVDGQFLHGVERMTLNNAIADPALVRQCLGYQLFVDAGIAAPRCNYAHVTVNEWDMGVYVNVEPVKKDFLRRNYPDDDGDLYEGTLSDFREGWIGTFEPKTDDTDPDHGILHDVVEALESPDDELRDALGSRIDLDNFTTFWAMEVLVAHMDGYAGNTNNYFVYRDPTTDLITFIPWGIDAIFHHYEVWGFNTADAVLANGVLANRLFFHDELGDEYLARLESLLDEVWDEDALLDEVDRMSAVVDPAALPDPWREDSLDELRVFITERREIIQESLDAGPTWDLPAAESPCLAEMGTLEVTFDTTWDTLGTPDPLNTGVGTIGGTWDGEPLPTVEGGAIAGETGGSAGIAALGLSSPTEAVEAAVLFELTAVEPGTYFLDLGMRVGYYMTLDLETEDDFQFKAYVAQGDLVLEEASAVDGAPIRGTFNGDLLVPVTEL